jgi:hypothetical protein
MIWSDIEAPTSYNRIPELNVIGRSSVEFHTIPVRHNSEIPFGNSVDDLKWYPGINKL